MTLLNDRPVGAIVPAQDLERAKQFYNETLGLDMIREAEGGVLFEAGQGTTIMVYPRPDGEPAEHTVAGWTVDDIEAAVDKLKDRGVKFEQYDRPGLKTDKRGIADAGGMLGAWFTDSEGNILSVGEFM